MNFNEALYAGEGGSSTIIVSYVGDGLALPVGR